MPSTHGAHTILIVDDEERLRKGLARSLSQEDCQTLTAASAEDALSLLKERKIDLVITDLVMPGMDGMTLVRNIKTIAPGIKIVIITAYGSAESMKEAEELGVACYLAKPFDLSHLKSRVNELLAGEPLPCDESSGSGRHGTMCSICLARRKALRKAFGLTRKALPYIRPRNVIPALGRVTRAASRLAGRTKALRSICLAGGKSLRAAAGLTRKALPYIRPRNVMLVLGRVTRVTSELASVFKKEVKRK